MKDKLRIFVVDSDGAGGLTHYTYQLCTALSNEGAEVTLVTATEYELQDLPHNFRVIKLLRLWKRFEDEYSSDKWLNRVRRLYMKLRRAIRGIRWVFAWASLTVFLMRSKPDIIQFSKMNFAVETYFITFLHSRGLILSQICHEFEEREGQNRLEMLLLGVGGNVYSNFSAIFFHAEENRKRFFSTYSSISKQATHIIPHGNSGWLLNFRLSSSNACETRRKYGLQDEERVILFFGLLAPSKGLEDLVEAFAMAREQCDAKLVIAGYPTKHIDMESLIRRISQLNLTDQVILDTRYIPLEEIGVLMNMASVVVYPYRSSTQSGALQAAYTFGRPVIATATGGLPEAVEDGGNGFLVPPRSPRDLADKIVLLVNNPDLEKKMGEYAKHLSETRFNWNSIARQILAVYDELLDTKPTSQ